MGNTAIEHWQYVLALARRAGAGLDPEDLAQDVYERWLRASATLTPTTNPRAWMTVVLRHLVIDRLRRRRISPEYLLSEPAELEAPLPHGCEDPEPAPWWSALGRADVEAVLGELSEAQRLAFQLFELEGKSYEEVAAALQISKSSVGVRVLRARRKIREILSARGAERRAAA